MSYNKKTKDNRYNQVYIDDFKEEEYLSILSDSNKLDSVINPNYDNDNNAYWQSLRAFNKEFIKTLFYVS